MLWFRQKALCRYLPPHTADPTCPGHVLEGGESQQLVLGVWCESHTSELLFLTGFPCSPGRARRRSC